MADREATGGLPGLARLRKARGLSQAALYGELYRLHGEGAVSRASIQNYEGGTSRGLRLDHAIQIADFLSVTLDELAGRSLDDALSELDDDEPDPEDDQPPAPGDARSADGNQR